MGNCNGKRGPKVAAEEECAENVADIMGGMMVSIHLIHFLNQ